MSSALRGKLVAIALEWQERYGIAPQITTPLSEYDAAMLIGFPEAEYSDHMQDKTAVGKGSDFTYKGIRYQVKANRPAENQAVASQWSRKPPTMTGIF